MKRRIAAQFLFFATGALALLLFGGVELWSKGLLSCLLAIACVLEGSVQDPDLPGTSSTMKYLSVALASWLALSLIPWPMECARWISPGQQMLLNDLSDWKPAWLHLSTAARETWIAAFELLGFGATVYLSWRWAGSKNFRMAVQVAILALGVIAGLAAVGDRITGNKSFYGLRFTSQVSHWGPFVNRNHFSNYLNIAGILGLGIFFRHGFRRGPERAARVRSAIALMGALFCFGLSLAAGSKGGFLSLATGLIFFAALFGWSKSDIRAQFLVAGLLLSIGIVLAFARPVLERTETWMTGGDSAEGGRWQVWRDTLQMSSAMGARGIGVGAFEWTFPAFQTTQGHKRITHVENEYLQCWAEWGLGAFIWLGFLWLVIERMKMNLKHGATGWQLAGWSALGITAIHSLVDFPLRLPANAWAIAALLGVLTRSHAEYILQRPEKHRNFFLLSSGCVLMAVGMFAFLGREDVFENISQQLSHKGSWEEALRAREKYPFYWRAHEVTADVAAFMPDRMREVQNSFARAQRLAQADPMISFRAGMLFWRRNPSLARDFFTKSLSISDAPLHLFSDLIQAVPNDPRWLAAILPLAADDLERWKLFAPKLNEKKDPALLEIWFHLGETWLDDPVQRVSIMRLLLFNGGGETVLKAFRQAPPLTSAERFCEADALVDLGRYEECAVVLQGLWKAQHPENDGLDQEGMSLMARGQWTDAIQVWKKLLNH